MEPLIVTPGRSVLVLGGARSGKSRYAQDLGEASGLEPVFLATAQAFDEEMRERIAVHKAERSHRWITREEPLQVRQAIAEEAAPHRVVLVDCLTVWLSNMMLAGQDLRQATDELASAIAAAAGPIILVSNEVGQGIVPATPLGRAFRDAQGSLNQALAAACQTVVVVTAGCPALLKPVQPFRIALA